MKKLYIAIGSTALNALTALVYRYREYGILKDSAVDNKGTGEDFFVGIDSDGEQAAKFQSLSTNVDWLLGLKMDQDNALLSLTKEAHPGWEQVDYTRGVGGHRTHSLQSLDFTRDRNFTRILDKFKNDPNSLVILIGSAFGGTSTGSYWNFATWLRRELNEKVNPYNNFFGFLLFPDGKRWNTTFSSQTGMSQSGDAKYREMTANVCNFLRDMEQLRIENAILKKIGSDDTIRFCPISLAQSEAVENAGMCFGIAGRNKEIPGSGNAKKIRAVDSSMGSLLPTESVFLIATAKAGEGDKAEKSVSEMVAEELLLFGKFDIAGLRKGGNDNIMKHLRDAAPKGNTTRLAPEGFIEMHFISARTKRPGVMAEYIKGLLVERLSDFGNMDSSVIGPATSEWIKISGTMRQCILSPREEPTGLDGEIRKLIDDIVDSQKTKADDWKAKGEQFLAKMKRDSKGYLYSMSDQFLEKVLEAAKEEAKNGNFSLYPEGRVPFTMAEIRALHTELFSSISQLKDAQTNEHVRKALLALVENFWQKLRDEAEKRRKLPFWTGVGGSTKRKVIEDLKIEARKALEAILKLYRHVLSCDATVFNDISFETLAMQYRRDIWAKTHINNNHVYCISKPEITPADRKAFSVEFGSKKDSFYELRHFFEDALRVLTAYLDSKRPFDLERHVLDYVNETREIVVGGGESSPKSPTAEQLSEPLFDGIEGVSGYGNSKNFERRPVWGTMIVPFIVEDQEGEKKKTAENTKLVAVTMGEIGEIGDWDQLFRLQDGGGDSTTPFNTEMKFENQAINRFNPNDRHFWGTGNPPPHIDDYWMGDFEFDWSIKGFLYDNYHTMDLEPQRQQRQRDEQASYANYLRLLKYEESVQFGLVLGCISEKLLKTPDQNGKYFHVRAQGDEYKCLIPDGCGNRKDGLKAVSPALFKWVRYFIGSGAGQEIWSNEESGAKMFFEHLSERENRVLDFSWERGYELDYQLDETDKGNSLNTLKRIFAALSSKIEIVVE